MILYHGSEHRIEKPQFGKGKLHNDYGRGFYCTEHIVLANEWAIDHNRNGYCNAYKIDIESLNVLQLNDSMYSILHWITVLLENRTFDILTDFGKEAVAYLKENFSLPYHDADIIIGYRADDSYFSYASDFINNIISLQTLATFYVDGFNWQFPSFNSLERKKCLVKNGMGQSSRGIDRLEKNIKK
ncbi:MAG: DUF3990 domain-containing protein [Lachnospiraceae bacterium]|nr:DUF3990 domain-containing protein [Lachnospiraceae bacterium]